MFASTSRLTTAAVLLAGVGVATAQSISSQCQSTLLTIAGSPEADCLNLGGLLPVITAGANSSLVQPINSWLSATCAQDACSNQTLSDVVANLTSGCSSDLSSLGLDSSDEGSVVSLVQQVYPIVREVACLKMTSNNTLCVTDLLSDLESSVGTLSLNNIVAALSQVPLGGAPNVPSSISCSDCAKQAYNVINQAEPSVAQQSNVTSTITNACGASFLDGTTPSDIAEGTGSAAPTSGAASGALSFSVSNQALAGVAVSSLVAVFSAFTVLA